MDRRTGRLASRPAGPGCGWARRRRRATSRPSSRDPDSVLACYRRLHRGPGARCRRCRTGRSRSCRRREPSMSLPIAGAGPGRMSSCSSRSARSRPTVASRGPGAAVAGGPVAGTHRDLPEGLVRRDHPRSGRTRGSSPSAGRDPERGPSVSSLGICGSTVARRGRPATMTADPISSWETTRAARIPEAARQRRRPLAARRVHADASPV